MKKKNNIKKLKLKKESVKSGSITKKLNRTFFAYIIIFILLFIRLGWLQIVQSSSLKEMAYQQQVNDTIISPKRGTIYDTNKKVLAISAQVDTVSINPGKVKYKDDTLVEPSKLATIFSTIFGLEYEDVLAKINSNSSSVVIAEKQEKDKIDLLKTII